MNIIEFTLNVDKTLKKLFGDENVSNIIFKPYSKEKNKIYFTVVLKGKKSNGFIFHSSKLSGKDIRNILFAYKRNLFDLIAKEDSNVKSSNEKV